MYKYLVSKILNYNSYNKITRKIFSIKKHAEEQFKEWKNELLEDYAGIEDYVEDPYFQDTLRAEYCATINDDYVELDGSEVMIERVEEVR